MLRLSEKHGSLFPTLDVADTDITTPPGVRLFCFSVEDGGLGEWTGCPRFRVEPACWQAMKLFVDELKRLGAEPRFESYHPGVIFVFKFDASSTRNRAIYELATAEDGREIHTSLYCTEPDRMIRRKTRQLDEAMRCLIELCGVSLQSRDDRG